MIRNIADMFFMNSSTDIMLQQHTDIYIYMYVCMFKSVGKYETKQAFVDILS